MSDKSSKLHSRIETYFERESEEDCIHEEFEEGNEEGEEEEEEDYIMNKVLSWSDIIPVPNPQQQTLIKADMRVFYNSMRNELKFLSPRAIARIFTGLPSPAYPAFDWKSTPWWSKYSHFDFQILFELSVQIVIGKSVKCCVY